MRVLLAILLMLPGSVLVADESTDEPRESGITEQVDVQLVLLDVTVVDKDRSIVTGLTKEDFVLRLDHEVVPIVSLDMACPDEPVDEPPAVEPEETATDWLAPDRERRIVFAVDYRHLEQTQRVEVLHQVKAAIERLHRPRETLMIVALTDFLRVELPPTTDTEAAIATLERMENDISLWLPPFDHLHDMATFEALEELTSLLGAFEGEKTIVLFSNWPSSGFNYDDSFENLVRRAARFRVSYYTVWTRGLRTHGTSRNLARLAVQTGGRFTERSNDFSLGYARAQRDSSCRYTVGFHDTPEDPDRTRRVDLRVDRRGIRVYHHDHYAPEDRDAAPAEVAQGALAWPELYASDAIDVALVPLRPVSRRRWETAFTVESVDPSDEPVHVRARLRRGNTRWTRTDETIEAPFAVAQPIELKHGDYVSSTTAIWPGEERPRSAWSRVELPELGERGWWVGEPLVLRPLGEDPEDLDHPLGARVPVLSRTTSDSLSLLHDVCRYGLTEEPETVRVSAAVDDGQRTVYETEIAFEFSSGTGVRCQRLDETLPALPPGGYTARITMQPRGQAEVSRARAFTVLAGSPQVDAMARP